MLLLLHAQDGRMYADGGDKNTYYERNHAQSEDTEVTSSMGLWVPK